LFTPQSTRGFYARTPQGHRKTHSEPVAIDWELLASQVNALSLLKECIGDLASTDSLSREKRVSLNIFDDLEQNAALRI